MRFEIDFDDMVFLLYVSIHDVKKLLIDECDVLVDECLSVITDVIDISVKNT
jgi:hypothetical protein